VRRCSGVVDGLGRAVDGKPLPGGLASVPIDRAIAAGGH